MTLRQRLGPPVSGSVWSCSKTIIGLIFRDRNFSKSRNRVNAIAAGRGTRLDGERQQVRSAPGGFLGHCASVVHGPPRGRLARRVGSVDSSRFVQPRPCGRSCGSPCPVPPAAQQPRNANSAEQSYSPSRACAHAPAGDLLRALGVDFGALWRCSVIAQWRVGLAGRQPVSLVDTWVRVESGL